VTGRDAGEDVADVEPNADGWIPVVSADDLPEGKPIKVTAGQDEVLLYLKGEQIWAIGDRCTHQGAQLHKGRVGGSGSDPVVTCPIHGSMFRLDDGRVMRGPAPSPVPAFETRLAGDTIEVRRKP
jgi:nitrite reductase/ring-hydroxylating ferredoxin subunit